MDVVPDDEGLPTVKELRDPAFAGTLPDWIADGSDGGAADARDAGHDGGYWRLSPEDGSARLETAFPLDPAAYDVLELETRLRSTGEEGTALVGFESAVESLVYGFDGTDPSIDDRVRATHDDHVETAPARRVDASFEHDVVLRWDVTAARAELWLDGGMAATGTIEHLEATEPVRAVWHARGSGSELRVHRAALRYRTNQNPV